MAVINLPLRGRLNCVVTRQSPLRLPDLYNAIARPDLKSRDQLTRG